MVVDDESEVAVAPRRTRGKRNIIAASLAVVLVAGLAGWSLIQKNSSPVPKRIAQKVSFPVYYPEQAKLPGGYTLDLQSFTSPVKNGVAYAVVYSGGKKIVFSVQAKPSDNELQSFNGNYIPLHLDYQTALGQAEIGAYHAQTLVSLPVIDGPWIVMTAPSDINQDQLKQVIHALRKP